MPSEVLTVIVFVSVAGWVIVIVLNALTVIIFVCVLVLVIVFGGGTVQPRVTVVNTVFGTEAGQKVAVVVTIIVVALFGGVLVTTVVWIIVLLFVTIRVLVDEPGFTEV